MALPSVGNQFVIEVKRNSNRKFKLPYNLRPIYIVSRIFGQMPFSIAYHSNGEIDRPVVKLLDAVWFMISMSVFVFLLVHFFTFAKANINPNVMSEITLVGIYFTNEISNTLGLLAIILDMCFRFKLVDMFKRIAIFDKKASLNSI